MESFSKLLRNLRVSHMEMLLVHENKEKKEKNQWMKVGEMIFETTNVWVKRETGLRMLYLYGKRRRLGRKVWGKMFVGPILRYMWWEWMSFDVIWIITITTHLFYVCFWLNMNHLWVFSWRNIDIKVLIQFDWGVSKIFGVESRTRKVSY